MFDPRAYAELAGGSFRTIVFETMRDSALVALSCLLLGLPAAYVYARLDARYLPVIMLAILVPYFTSTLIRSYAWIAILGNQGLLNRALLWLGLVDAPVKLAYTWFGMIVAMAQVQLPLFIIPVLAVMRRVDPRLVRAAKTLGADAVTAFFTVYLPLIAPGVIAAVVMVFMTTLGFYVTPALLGPPSTIFLSQSIEMRINGLADQPGAAAQSIVLLALTLLLAALFFRQLRAAFVPTEQDAPSRHTATAAAAILLVGECLVRSRRRSRRSVGWASARSRSITTLLLVGPLLVFFPFPVFVVQRCALPFVPARQLFVAMVPGLPVRSRLDRGDLAEPAPGYRGRPYRYGVRRAGGVWYRCALALAPHPVAADLCGADGGLADGARRLDVLRRRALWLGRQFGHPDRVLCRAVAALSGSRDQRGAQPVRLAVARRRPRDSRRLALGGV